ncbi:DUF3237 family protein [Paraburkholderia sediminicola]|uniref:DUF3237 family protein n=1 Tax=Paraburkholderia sediminicola TaxID=458836 RepID=UPI0038B7BB08
MPTLFVESLPAPLKSVQTRPLFVMRLDVKPIVIVGATPGPFRRVGIVPSGSSEGDQLSGKVLDGGSDRRVVRYKQRLYNVTLKISVLILRVTFSG